ncbi:MAG: YbjQ family protein [Planctomycetota bacterium]
MARRKPIHLFDSGDGPPPPGCVVPQFDSTFLVCTTPGFENRSIEEYLGVVTGEAIIGSDVVRDFFASVTNVIGGRSVAYEGPVRTARDIALAEAIEATKLRGGNALVGVDFDYEAIVHGIILVAVSGTAVRVGEKRAR